MAIRAQQVVLQLRAQTLLLQEGYLPTGAYSLVGQDIRDRLSYKFPVRTELHCVATGGHTPDALRDTEYRQHRIKI